jgi:hypothetical protein
VRRFLISNLPSRQDDPKPDEVAAAHARRDYLLSNYVEREGPIAGSPCWHWLRGCNRYGYGQVWYEGYLYRATRLNWSLFHGPIPDDLIIRHKCDSPRCIREDHLELGTYQDNARDRNERGRAASTAGSLNGSTRITEEIASRILEASNKGDSDWKVAETYGVSVGVVRKIAIGKTWVHIPGQRRPKRQKLSRFIGVTPNSTGKYPWRAYAAVNGRTIHLGSFSFEVDAAIARNTHDAYHGLPLSNQIPADENWHD